MEESSTKGLAQERRRRRRVARIKMAIIYIIGIWLLVWHVSRLLWLGLCFD